MTEPTKDRHRNPGMFIRLDAPAREALGRIRESTGLGIAAAITYAITTTDRAQPISRPKSTGKKFQKISRKSDN